MAYLKLKRTFRLTFIFMALAGLVFMTKPATAKKLTLATPESVAAQIAQLPEKERLYVLVNSEVVSNYTLAQIALKNGARYGSIDEEEELLLAVAKVNFMHQVQKKALPGKLDAYYADWAKILQNYLSGNTTFHEFIKARKSLHPRLQKILKDEMSEKEAKGFGKKHVKLIEKVSTSFYKPALREVLKQQREDIKNPAKFANTRCIPVKDKWKKCGLTGDVKQQIGKIKNQVAKGNAVIYKTMRIGDKFVIYVVYKQTKTDMEKAIKDTLKKHPTALAATYSLTALESLCADKNFPPVLKKTKTEGQLIVHSRDLLPIANLRFKNCADIKKLTSVSKPLTNK